MTKKPDRLMVGDKVRIASDLGLEMAHFPGAGELATVVEVTDAHARCGRYKYELRFPGGGTCAWYNHNQLTLVSRNAETVASHCCNNFTKVLEALKQEHEFHKEHHESGCGGIRICKTCKLIFDMEEVRP